MLLYSYSVTDPASFGAVSDIRSRVRHRGVGDPVRLHVEATTGGTSNEPSSQSFDRVGGDLHIQPLRLLERAVESCLQDATARGMAFEVVVADNSPRRAC